VPIRTELRSLLRLAFPIVLTQLSQMGMGVADTVMAGRYGAVDLAGVALGGNLFWPFLFFLSGVIMALTPTVAQLDGRGRGADAGEAVRQAAWIALAGGTGLVVLLLNAEPVYRRIRVDPPAIPVAADYLRMPAIGVLPPSFPGATPRTTMSRSVTMPTGLPSSNTGIAPTSISAISFAALCVDSFLSSPCTSLVMMSLRIIVGHLPALGVSRRRGPGVRSIRPASRLAFRRATSLRGV